MRAIESRTRSYARSVTRAIPSFLLDGGTWDRFRETGTRRKEGWAGDVFTTSGEKGEAACRKLRAREPVVHVIETTGNTPGVARRSLHHVHRRTRESNRQRSNATDGITDEALFFLRFFCDVTKPFDRNPPIYSSFASFYVVLLIPCQPCDNSVYREASFRVHLFRTVRIRLSYDVFGQDPGAPFGK